MNTDSRKLADAAVLEVWPDTHPDAWNVTSGPVCGLGDEFFYTHRADPSTFVYVCVEDGTVTACENN